MMTPLRTLIDGALDAAVIPGYTRIGYRLRNSDWDDIPARALEGRTVVITGATSGLGLAAAERLSALGARILLIGRNEDRLSRAGDRIGGPSEYHVADLALMSDVRRVAASVLDAAPRIDVLINNAGALFPEREVTTEGLEATFATNLLSPFLLTNLLLPRLIESAPARIITVASGGMYTQPLALEDLQSEHGYRGAAAYARAKRGQIDLTIEWAERLGQTGVTAHAMHPGWADTPGVRSSLPGFRRIMRPLLRSAEEGADTIVWLAAAPEGATTSGLFWHDRRPRPTTRIRGTGTSPEKRRRLWDELSRFAGAGIDVV